jgi:hypothetical protein
MEKTGSQISHFPAKENCRVTPNTRQFFYLFFYFLPHLFHRQTPSDIFQYFLFYKPEADTVFFLLQKERCN